MKMTKFTIAGLMLVLAAGFLISACTPEESVRAKSIAPSVVEPIEGSEFKRVKLTEKAAERLGIQTALVREEQVVQKQTVVGDVVAERGGEAASDSRLWVHVSFHETDYKLVARDQPARILPLPSDDDDEDSGEQESGWTVEPDETSGLDDGEDNGEKEGKLDTALYYPVDSSQTGLVPGQRVFVEVALSGNGMVQMTIPYDALIYDVEGGTWVYVKEHNALTFVREHVTVDHIQGDLAFLKEGPPPGTEVVTVGGAELYGAETGVSK
jgi:hypothetical protein